MNSNDPAARPLATMGPPALPRQVSRRIFCRLHQLADVGLLVCLVALLLAGCGTSRPAADATADEERSADTVQRADSGQPGDSRRDAEVGTAADPASAAGREPGKSSAETGTRPSDNRTADAAGRSGEGGAPLVGSNPSDGQRTPAMLTPALLDESLRLGGRYMVANQTARGNFRYLVDARTGEALGTDNQVRQAGALWGLALIHQANPTTETEQAVRRGLEFYRRYSVADRKGGAFIEYPGDFKGQTGTVALASLAAIDFLRTRDPRDPSSEERAQLDAYLRFLDTLRRPDHHYYREYRWTSGAGVGSPSPYFDGEVLLALVKAAAYLDRNDLQPAIQQSTEAMWQVYVVQARQQEPDSDLTKSFYQWGTLALFHMVDAGWEGSESYAERVIELAHWMIDVHQTLQRRRNTGYAHEGLVCAWELARRTGDEASQRKIGAAIHAGLSRLTSWQVGGPNPNAFLREQGPWDATAIGGLMSAADDPRLRIDTTQHQMHAVILARRYLFP